MSASEYEAYIRTAELLALQKSEGERSHPDELLFQVTHQAMELWLKAAADDIRRIPGLIDDGRLHRAAHLCRRVAQMLTVCAEQLRVLEMMDPADYHPIRAGLGRGSGQDSPGFNWILDETPSLLRPPFDAALRARGLTLVDLHRNPDAHYDLFQLAEGMMELDTWFQKFRYLHFSLVRRIIGNAVKSLKGVPASQLIHGTVEPLFPELWDAINELTRTWTPEGGG